MGIVRLAWLSLLSCYLSELAVLATGGFSASSWVTLIIHRRFMLLVVGVRSAVEPERQKVVFK